MARILLLSLLAMSYFVTGCSIEDGYSPIKPRIATDVPPGPDPGPGCGQTLIKWEAPTQNVDGTVLTDLGGYLIYVGVQSRNYYAEIEINNPAATEYMITGLVPGQKYYIAAKAVDMEGNRSAFSNEVTKTVDLTCPELDPDQEL